MCYLLLVGTLYSLQRFTETWSNMSEKAESVQRKTLKELFRKKLLIRTL